MVGRQLGLQMWGSPEPRDSVSPKWLVCSPRRDKDVRGVWDWRIWEGSISYCITPSPALLLGLLLVVSNLGSQPVGVQMPPPLGLLCP